MRLQRTIILIIALFGAGLAGFLAWLFTSEAPQQVAEVTEVAPPPPPAMTDILVAARDIRIGTKLQRDDLAWSPVLDSALRAEYITRPQPPEKEESEAAPADDGIAVLPVELPQQEESQAQEEAEVLDGMVEWIGDVALVAIAAGTPITGGLVSDSFFSALITPGMRAVSVNIGIAAAVDGLISPNDRVDVILNRNINPAEGANTSGGSEGFHNRLISELLIPGARVLAVNQDFAAERGVFETVRGALAGDGSQAQARQIITLELSPEDALILESSQKEGALSLALHSFVGGGGGQAQTQPNQRYQFIRVVRGGRGENIPVRKLAP